ncbi:MAG: MmcB family DNA repair protein [Stellaceae bacterium]
MRETRDMAREICRGASRLLWQQGFTALPEVALASGRRADLLALGRDGEIRIVEIKSSAADFRADRKWPEYREFCDRLYFAVADDFDVALIPMECGLIRADAWGGAILREAPHLPLPAARRRAVTLRFALLAGRRLGNVADPDFFPRDA